MERVTYMKSKLDSPEHPFLADMTDAVFADANGDVPSNMIPINDITTSSEYLNKAPEDEKGDAVWIDAYGLGITANEYNKRHADPIFHMFFRIKNQVKRMEDIVKDAGGNIEGGLGYAEVFQKSGWNWKIIRAFLYVAKDYLIQIGRTFDDFMNGKSILYEMTILIRLSNLTYHVHIISYTQLQQRPVVRLKCVMHLIQCVTLLGRKVQYQPMKR